MGRPTPAPRRRLKAEIAPGDHAGAGIGDLQYRCEESGTSRPASSAIAARRIAHCAGFQARLTGQRIRWEDGYVIPPTEPGLGIAFDEALARATPYQGAELHLGMGGSALEP